MPKQLLGEGKRRRHSVEIPDALYLEVRAYAQRNDISTVDLTRDALRTYLNLVKYLDDPDTELLVRKDGKEKVIINL